ncbi:MAG: hypothetical protein ACK5N9_06085 [Pirellula sp.]|jgi:hypothetical protein
MSQKTTSKGSDLRQMTFDYSKQAYRTKRQAKGLEVLLAIPGIHRGSDSRFVVTDRSGKNTRMRKTK